MLTPVTSAGSRSGVNCSRSKAQPRERDSDLASMVLPTPGTSSISTWPRLSMAITHSSISASLPTSTRLTFRTMRSPKAATLPFSIGFPPPGLMFYLPKDNVAVRYSLPRDRQPGEPAQPTTQRAARKHHDVVDKEGDHVRGVGRPGIPHQADVHDGAGQGLHHDEADGHQHAVPDAASKRTQATGHESSHQQDPKGEQLLSGQAAAVGKQQDTARQLRQDGQDQANAGREPVESTVDAPLVGVGHPLSLRSRPRPGICAEYSPNFQLVPIRQRSRDGRGRMHASAAFAYARWDYGRVGGAQG